MPDWPISRLKNSLFAPCRIAFGEPGAKQSQDDKPLTHQEPVRTASVDIAFGATCRFAVVTGEKSPQLGRCFRGCLPPRSSPLGLSDSDRRFDEALLVAASPFKMDTFAPDVDQPAKAGPRYHRKRHIASALVMGYIKGNYILDSRNASG
jgi:hypothetical protein